MLRLLIGNKTYSSWSLRPWLVLQHFDIAFEEIRLSFNDPEFTRKVLAVSPAGTVPVLLADDKVVWDSLAIIETLAEDFAGFAIWPTRTPARAMCRSMCAQMHSGFSDLRRRFPMNAVTRFVGIAPDEGAARDIASIHRLWNDARQRFGSEGPYLFGDFSAADAYFAPVVLRFWGYDLVQDSAVQSYVATMLAHPGLQKWMNEARAEQDFVEHDEPYRQNPESGDLLG